MNKKREEFFRLHQCCAFCGGRAAAMEIDHVPSRQFFHFRQWPEEFEFPACASCNRRTKDAEQIVAFIARLFPDPRSESEFAEFQKVCEALSNNYPNVLHEMQLTPRQARKMQRAAPALIASKVRPVSVNALSLQGPLVRSAIKQFATKLFLALHYRESGEITRAAAGVAWKFYSNFQRIIGDYPDEIYQLLAAGPRIERNRADLSGQFNCSFRLVSPTKAVYSVHLRAAFALFGYVCHEKSEAQRFGTNYSLIVPFDP